MAKRDTPTSQPMTVTASVVAPPEPHLLQLPAMSEALQAALDAPGATAAEIARLDEAIARTVQREDAEQAALDRETAAEAGFDKALALEADDARYKAVDAQRRKATDKADEHRAGVARFRRARESLAEERRALVAHLEEQLKVLDAEISMPFRLAVSDAIEMAVASAIVPLIEALRQVAVIDQATNRGWFSHVLSETTVPKVRGTLPHIGNGQHHSVSGLSSKFRAPPPIDPGLADLHDAAAAPLKRLRELTTALREAKDPTSPAARAQREREAQERAAAEAAEQALADAEEQARVERSRQPPPLSQEKRAAQFREARRVAAGADPDDSEFYVLGEGIWAPSREIALERYAAMKAARERQQASADAPTAAATNS